MAAEEGRGGMIAQKSEDIETPSSQNARTRGGREEKRKSFLLGLG